MTPIAMFFLVVMLLPAGVFADARASVETRIEASGRTTLQVSGAAHTSTSSGGSVDVRTETIENGVRHSSSFHTDLRPGESFEYATSTGSRTHIGVGVSDAHTARPLPMQVRAVVSNVPKPESSAEPDVAPSRLLALFTRFTDALRALLTDF